MKEFMKYMSLAILAGLNGFLIFCGILFVLSLFSCTYNVSMAHTSGQASDVIDDNQTPTATVSPTLDVPMVGK
jgi:hypothetical protein